MAAARAGTSATTWLDRIRPAVRALVAVCSTLVFIGTWYGWAQYRELINGTVTSNVTARPESDGATDILLVGMDSRTDARGNPLPPELLERLNAGENSSSSLTDTIILLHVPTNGTRATAFSFPRDSYVSIPGHGKHKINSAYGRGKEAELASNSPDGPGEDPRQADMRSANAGRETLIDTVEGLTGVSVDHYAEVNLLGFSRITHALGGVPVCLAQPVHDPMSGADFPEGPQRLAGPDALAFVRQRHGLPRGDLDRVVRQQAFLAGLARSSISSGLLTDPGRLRTVMDTVQSSLVLDQGWNLGAFVDRVHDLAGGRIEFNTIPVTDPSYNTPDGAAVQVDPNQVRQTVRQGMIPEQTPPATESAPPQQSTKPRSEVTRQSAPATSHDAPDETRTSPSDGSATQSSDQITADGIPCVN